MSFLCGDRVEVTLVNGNYPDWRWVRRGRVTRVYPEFVVVRYDDGSWSEERTVLGGQVRKLSILELLAEAADES